MSERGTAPSASYAMAAQSSRPFLFSRKFGYLLIVLVALGLIWMAVFDQIFYQRRSDRQQGEQETSNLARAFAENISLTIDAIDQSLLFMRRAYAANPAAFDLRDFAKSGQLINELTLQVSMTGPDGIMLMNNNGPTKDRVDLSDREHVRVHMNTDRDRLFISRPVLGRVSGKWSIQFTRKLITADGKFGGVLVVSLDPSYLARFYNSLQIGNGAVMLVGDDGGVRVRAPSDPAGSALGRTLSAPLMQQLMSGPDHGTYQAISEIDGVERINSYRRLEHQPLMVVVGLATADVFADSERNQSRYLAFGALLTLLVCAVALELARHSQTRQRAAQSLTATLENMSQGIIMVDGRDRIAVINRRAIEMLGLPPELIKQGANFQDILDWQIGVGEFDPSDPATAEIRRLAETGGFSPDLQVYERVRANGLVLEVRTKQLDGGGAVRTYTDVTERRRNAEALATERDAAEAAGRARSDFLAVMSHEIRTPMNGIIGVAGLLLEMPLGPTEKQYATIIRDSGDHLLQLINDILDFSSLEAGKLKLEETVFDIRAVIASATDLMALQARSKGLTLDIEVHRDVPKLASGDPRRLRQILLNLVNNSIKFTQAGSVRVSASSRTGAPGTLHLDVAVSDTGIGIPPDAMGRLFQEFSQVDSSISRRFGGTGLGLAISRRLVQQMGGKIAVESIQDVGSVFRFDVVLRNAPSAKPLIEPGTERGTAPGAGADTGRGAEPADALQDAGNGQRYHVLIAEDNATNRMIVTRMLEKLGHRVEAVNNGREAVEAVRKTPYDVVLMDMRMPEMDGLAATAAIRAMHGTQADIPIIGLTANAQKSDEEACLAAGMNRVATKPITSAALARVLDEEMSGRAQSPPG